MLQDPLRQNAPSATDDDLAALVEQGPVSNRLGRAVVAEEAQVTDRVLGFIQSDTERAFDADRAQMFGEEYRNDLSPEDATRRYGVEGYLSFDGPVNVHRAEEMQRQAQLRRYREETASRANLSGLETIGASIIGSATDPVMLPTWFIGGGSAALRALRVAPAATRAAQVGRGAAVGIIDGLTGGAVAEGINYSARRSSGEDYDMGDALKNILVGGVFGGVVGGGVGAIAPTGSRPGAAVNTAPVSRDVLRAAMMAQETGGTPRQVSRDPDGAGPAGGGAVGALQLLPDTAKAMARRAGLPFDERRLLNDVDYNVRLSDEYMGFLTDRYGGDSFLAVTAYHAGEGNVDSWLRRHGDPRRGGISREGWLARVGKNNPRSARYPREVFARMGMSVDGAGSATLEALSPNQPPAVTRGLTDNERVGAFAEALEAAAEDAPLDLGPLLARNGLEALDEASAVPSIRGQWLEADVAVTRTGAEIPVRFAVVEMDDLITSHGDALTAEAAYPQALQPRDRSRPGSVAENYELERDLNPKLLMRDKAASAGAAIISPGGLVESGNGRIIALRRSARTGTEAWGRYVAELKAQGAPVDGFRRPVLVRMRSEAMTGQRRADMAVALNRSQTEGYSPVEQAMADARRLDAETVRMIEGDDPFSAANRPFQRAFQDKVAPGDKGVISDAEGQINPAGRERVRAALVQAAYGDRELTAALFDTADETLMAVGNALADAAPAWARMRAEAPRHVDMTENLTQAVHLLRHARQSREATDKVLHRLLASEGLFDGAAVSVETEAFVRLMFRDADLTQARGSERLGWALKTYARAAAEVADGPNLFGEVDNAQTIAARISERLGSAEGPGRSGLAYAGGSEAGWTTREAAPAVLDLRPAEPVGEGSGGGSQRPGDGGAAARTGGRDGPPQRLEFEDAAAHDRRVATWLEANPDAISADRLAAMPEAARMRWAAEELTRMQRDYVGDLTSEDPDFAAARARLKKLESNLESGAYEADPEVRRMAARFAPAKPDAAARVQALIDADPEMKALVEDTEALAAAGGVDVPAFERSTEPSTVAEAIRAAAFCLTTEFDV